MRLRSIEHKIFMLILTICLVPPLLLLLLLGVGSRLTFEQTIGEELSGRAEYLAGTFDRFLNEKTEKLRALASSTSATLAGADAAKLQHLAATAAAETGAGGLVCVSADRPTSPTVILGAAANQVMAGRSDLLGDLRKYTRWVEESLYFRPFTQTRLSVPPAGCFQDLEIAVPARVDPLCLLMFAAEPAPGRRLFFLFEAAALVDAFRHSHPQHPEVFYVYSSSGFIPWAWAAADPLLTAALRDRMNTPHKEQRWFVMREDGRPTLFAPADSNLMQHRRLTAGQGPVWSILLPYDMENFLSPLAAYVWLSVLVALVLVLLTLVAGLVAGRRIARPLADLRHQAEEIALGHLDARATVQSRDEIGELAVSFNTMATRLHESYDALEERLGDNQLRAGHLNVLGELNSAIVQQLGPDEIFQTLVREAGRLARFDALWIARLDEGGRELRVTHIHPGGLIALLEDRRIPLAGSLHGRVIEAGEAIHAEIGPHDRTGFFETRSLRAEGFQSYLVAPLPSPGGVSGTLTLAATAPDAFNAAMVPVAGSLAAVVAIGIEQADLARRAASLAAELEQRAAERARELERLGRKPAQPEQYFATGRLAGNLAHEINNPLGIIKNYLRLAEKDLQAAQAAGRPAEINPDHLRMVNEEVERITRLVGQVLDLHRPGDLVAAPLDFNALLGEILTLMEPDLARQNIRVVRELAGGLPRPPGPPDLARQLLINLLRNAQDAMEAGGGVLTVRTTAVPERADGAGRRHLRLRVSDTGCGIPPEHLPEIFDPFFTTKPPGKGTGLGLCVSDHIVRMMHGRIDVESQPGAGTSVLVTIPAETENAD